MRGIANTLQGRTTFPAREKNGKKANPEKRKKKTGKPGNTFFG